MTDELTPEEEASKAEIARFQAKLGAAPKGSRLAANMRLRIDIEMASDVEGEKTARAAHAAALQAIADAEAEAAKAAEG